ncbi:MAG TPA: hypothetical protein PLP76_04275 [Bacteroidales bacterium]|nr:hypothetical protein [Bacteroidales bacterium]
MKKNIKKLSQVTNNCFFKVIFILFFTLWQINTFGQNFVTTPCYTRAQTQCFKDSIVLKGDIESWFWLGCTNDKEYPKYSNGKKNRYELEFPYVLILANRYDNPQACHSIYVMITELYDAYKIEMDSATIEFVLFYLNKGAELGDEGCLKKLYEFYIEGKYVDKDVEKANSYMIQLDAINEGKCFHK